MADLRPWFIFLLLGCNDLAQLFRNLCLALTDWPNNGIGCGNGSMRVAAQLWECPSRCGGREFA